LIAPGTSNGISHSGGILGVPLQENGDEQDDDDEEEEEEEDEGEDEGHR